MLGWEFPPNISGGLGTACHGITRGLYERRVDVVFVVPHARGDEDRRFARVVGCEGEDRRAAHVSRSTAPPLGRGAAAASLDVLRVESALHPYARRTSGVGALGRRATDPYGGELLAEVRRYAERVVELAREYAFDVVHAHDWMTFPAGLAVKERCGRPLVAHVHACEHDRAGEHVDECIKAVEELGLQSADRTVCVSNYTAGRLREHYAIDHARLRVVHNGIDTRLAPPPHRARRHPLVLFLGRVTRQKGPDRFVEAAALVAAREPDARFVIAGDGDLLASMIERVAELGLARRFHFTGFLPRRDVRRLFAMADVFVMPSLSEPFGLAPLEALACGVPAIISRQSGVAEVLASCPKVDADDVAGLAEEIVALLRDPFRRRILARRGQEEVRALRWERCADGLLDVYAEVVP